jgi:tRNA pseudouridine55 synthase
MNLEGVIPIYKTKGMTSHDVVAKARRILGMKRIGHTGTLDPSVTGVLPLCIGRATRIVEYVQELPKEYEAKLVIGLSTDTEDLTGNVIIQCDDVMLTAQQLTETIQSFVGTIQQVPPMYSAVKIDGKRLYELARAGIEVERQPREVTIYGIQILDMNLSIPYPEVRFRVQCSKGTYIRTLCADIGRKLGLPAAMGELIRTRTGPIGLEQCVTLEQLEKLKADQHLDECLIPTDQALAYLPSYVLTEQQSVLSSTGRTVIIPELQHLEPSRNQLWRIYTPVQHFLGIFQWDSQDFSLKPVKIFHPLS